MRQPFFTLCINLKAFFSLEASISRIAVAFDIACLHGGFHAPNHKMGRCPELVHAETCDSADALLRADSGDG